MFNQRESRNRNLCPQPFEINQNQMVSQTQKVPEGNNSKLFPISKGFMLGNLFDSLYSTWCGFTNYPLNPTNRRQALLTQVQMFDFAAHEVNLYLDTHPKDKEMIAYFGQLNQEYRKAKTEFEQEFGPLNVNSIHKDHFPWIWNECPWPWEKQ